VCVGVGAAAEHTRARREIAELMALKSKHGAGGEYARAWQPSVRRVRDHICAALMRSVCAGDAVAGVRAPAAARAVRGGVPT
jgi:hypothetical protein